MNVTAPRVGVPIGYVSVGGKRVPVEVDPEYLRFFDGMHIRVGGVTGPGTPDLSISQFEDAGIAEQQAEFYAFRDGILQSTEAALREEINALRMRVETLEQGESL